MAKRRKMKLSMMAEKTAEKVCKTTAWASYDGDAAVLKALRSILTWRTTTWSMHVDPMNVSKWKTHVAFSQQVGHFYEEVGWRGEMLGAGDDDAPTQEG